MIILTYKQQTTYENLIDDEKVDRTLKSKYKLETKNWRYKPMGPIDHLFQYESGNA